MAGANPLGLIDGIFTSNSNYKSQKKAIEAAQKENIKQAAQAIQNKQDQIKQEIGDTRANMAASGIDLSSQSFNQQLAKLDAEHELAKKGIIDDTYSTNTRYEEKKSNAKSGFIENTLLGTAKYASGGIGKIGSFLGLGGF